MAESGSRFGLCYIAQMETMPPGQAVTEIAEKLATASKIAAHANDPEMLIETLALLDEARAELTRLIP